MKDEKLSIAKRKVYQAVKSLDIKQVVEIGRYIRKLENKKYAIRNKERKEAQFNEVRSWPSGTQVVCSSFREPNFDSKTGIIVWHLDRRSIRSVVKFDEEIRKSRIWHVPSLWLNKATPETIKNIQTTAKFNQGLGKILTKALNNMESK